MVRPFLLAAALALTASCADGDAGRLRVAFVAGGDEPGLTALRGAQLGAEEADHAARLVGTRFELIAARADGPDAAERAARRLLRRGAFAVVGGGSLETCRRLAGVAEARGVLFLNVGCRDEGLRMPGAVSAFHVEASEGMYRDALATLPGGASAEPVLWHGGLTRYGAAQLNERYERRFGERLDGRGWAGWMAVKLLWEAASRTGSTDAQRLSAYLTGDGRFDGHKGEPLSFGHRDRQLRQPVYLLRAGDDTAAAGPTAEDPREGLVEGAIPATGRLVLVTNEGSGDVTVIDVASLRAVARIRVGSRPRGIRLSPDGRLAYVALSDDAPQVESDRDAIAVVDVRTGSLLARHAAGSDPEAFAVSPDGRTLYVSNEDAGTATITDVATGEARATLVVGIEPEGVAVSPDGRWVYVTAETSNTVSVIDTRVDEVVASFMVEVRPRAAAFSPDGRWAWVSNEISGTLSLVDVSRHAVVASVALGEGAKPVGVVVSPDGRRVYVASGHSGMLDVVDAATRRLVAQVPVGRRPWGVDVTSDGRWIATANGPSDDVTLVDAATLQVVARVSAGRLPWGVAATP
jgi:PQQ-dependent catabolism-associated beta-propeller protein